MYKPAYMVVKFGEIKAFLGNYDNLADLRQDYPSSTFECWADSKALYVRLLTSAEMKERRMR